MSRIVAGGWRERLLFWLLLVFVIGYYWCPSTRALQSTPHDLVFYLGMLPAFLLLAPLSLWRGPTRSRLLALSLTFVVYLGASALWTRGDAELSLAQVGLFTLATTVFITGASELLIRTRWRQLTTAVVIAATSIAVVSVIAFSFGHRYIDDRLNSAIHFEHPNLFAHYLGFAALVCLLRILNTRWRGHKQVLPWAAAFVFLLGAMVLTGGRASMLALITGAGLAAGFNRDRRVGALFGLLLMLVLVLVTLATGDAARNIIARGDAGRDVIYRTFIERTADHRWTGLGIAVQDNMRFPKGSPEFPRGQNIRHPHSAFIATYHYGGLMGLGLMVLLLMYASVRAVRIARDRGDPTGAALLAFGVMCLLPDGHRLVSYPHLSSWLILWLPVSWIIAADREECSDGGKPVEGDPPHLENAAPGRRVFWILVVLFFAQRLLHLGPDIDTPQMWRQCDTAQYIRAFAEEGIDLLHPSVCWLADHKTTILEFPLPEAVAAAAYRLFGANHTVARVVFLLFFAGSAFFLFRFVRELVDESLARMVVLIYLIMPLSLYFSRAIHIDFSALFFVHGMAYFFARGVRLESARLMWIGSLFAALAMVIKAPYVLPVVAPLTVLAIRDRRWPFILRSLPALMLPALIFGLWEMHVYNVNSRAPDWFFIPHYRKLVQNGGWYFGTVAQRLDLMNWLRMGERFWLEILGTAGLVPAVIGTLVLWQRRSFTVLAWCGGSLLMLLIFFNLSRLHNYYLIPFLAPLACLVAVGILWLAETLLQRRRRSTVLAVLVLAIVAVDHFHYAENNYYEVFQGLIEGGEAIGRNTPSSSLVVVSAGEFDCRSPHLLYHADRYGWSIAKRHLDPQLLERLIDLGADHLAILDVEPPEDPVAAWLAGFDRGIVELDSTEARLFLYHFGTAPRISRSDKPDAMIAR